MASLNDIALTLGRLVLPRMSQHNSQTVATCEENQSLEPYLNPYTLSFSRERQNKQISDSWYRIALCNYNLFIL
jgi:hypothetical protein